MPFHVSEPSFQSLYVEILALDTKISSGTAFVATIAGGQNFLITNRHIVTGRDQNTGKCLSKMAAIPDTLRVWHNAKSKLGEFIQVLVPLTVGGDRVWIEHPELRHDADFVAIPIPDNRDFDIYPYRAKHFTDLTLQPSQRIQVVGFPFGERSGVSFAVWATGFVASEPEIDHGGRPVFLIDCRTREGQSGSPVIKYRHGGGGLTYENGDVVVGLISELLGIYSGRINADSDLGVVWKSSAIAELLEYACQLAQSNKTSS